MPQIVIFDFGEKKTREIGNIVEKQGVSTKILPFETPAEVLKTFPDLKGVIFSGGPKSVLKSDAFRVDQEIYHLGIPVLGICYGMQLMVKDHGGELITMPEVEKGRSPLNILGPTLLFKGISSPEIVYMNHNDTVETLPDCFMIKAETDIAKIAAAECVEKSLYAVQFHPEHEDSFHGELILKNFVKEICHCK